MSSYWIESVKNIKKEYKKLILSFLELIFL